MGVEKWAKGVDNGRIRTARGASSNWCGSGAAFRSAARLGSLLRNELAGLVAAEFGAGARGLAASSTADCCWAGLRPCGGAARLTRIGQTGDGGNGGHGLECSFRESVYRVNGSVGVLHQFTIPTSLISYAPPTMASCLVIGLYINTGHSFDTSPKPW